MGEVSQQKTTALVAAPPEKSTAGSQVLNVGGWAVQILVAVILLQTLYFKFTYAPETQLIFANRGGRPAATALGVIELICALLLLTPRGSALGALISLTVMSGAILTHLTSLGLEIVDPATGQGDRGLLFGLAVTAAIGSIVILLLRWKQLACVGARFAPA